MNDRIKVLYVDDEPINLQLFQLNLRKKYNVLVAENGIASLDILAINEDVALVVSDIKMPKMNGVEFIRAAKEKYPEIGYFILTGYEITEEIR
jgi:two-component system, response regulator, stage 0 sporulation protein F